MKGILKIMLKTFEQLNLFKKKPEGNFLILFNTLNCVSGCSDIFCSDVSIISTNKD